MSFKWYIIHDHLARIKTPPFSQGNKYRFWQIFVETPEEFPILIIQSKTSASTHEYSESNRASKYVMLLSNFVDENRGLSPVSEAGFRQQLVAECRMRRPLGSSCNLSNWKEKIA